MNSVAKGTDRLLICQCTEDPLEWGVTLTLEPAIRNANCSPYAEMGKFFFITPLSTPSVICKFLKWNPVKATFYLINVLIHFRSHPEL